ncbi:type II toxin-antitoxin system death-on-curing family toxin [Nitrosomonas sp. sh817]|uniref:type II toxin-antitoxin system death-on-curing family toxin n=1 Tax=Nitrosomonas sp. sh817 TaxID=3070658 RepID=UPI0027DBFC2E|nr:type II toxin-antitoxin system death-on-curing family toxin [Nitrosomonas sp. sh817]WMJ09619.1 type II toxin-antitoxin system death-on-curing family toxin [Nitrosomonas sp. sh817]
MKEYLTVPDVLAIHSILIKRYGGTLGIRDLGALESALFRLQSGYYIDIVAEAAALMESLAINHPFVDGNKRVAFAATDIFLRINGYRINCESMIIHADMMQMFETDTFDLPHLEPWLRKLVIKAS